VGTVLRDARMRHNIGVRELARRCGVAAATVVDWERSEAAETIQSRTLARALTAMGEQLTIASRPQRANPVRFERPEQRLGLELHRTIAMKLISDPDYVLDTARKKLTSLRGSVQGGAKAWVDRWEQLITLRDLGGLVDVMLGTTQPDIDMRSVSPFTGLRSQDERSDAAIRASAG
jgi:transcriptional regulator with XRE-family HTH domain